MNLVLWFGPFSPQAQAPGATLPGASLHAFVCKGDATGMAMPICRDVLAGFGRPDGRLLPGILAKIGLSESDVDQIAVGSFSAGHNILKPLLAHPADRARIVAVHSADSTYTSWADPARHLALAPPTYVAYCLDALQSTRLFVATASNSPNGDYPVGTDGLYALKAAVEEQTGRRFELVTDAAGIQPPPVKLWRLGNVLLADYQGKVTHPEHATKIAPQVWSQLIGPWLQYHDLGGIQIACALPAAMMGLGACDPPLPAWWVPGGGEPGPGEKIVAFLIGAGVAYAGVRAWQTAMGPA